MNVTVPGPTGGTVEAGQPLQSIVSAHPDFDDYDVRMESISLMPPEIMCSFHYSIILAP
jgi:hypothetical protein